MRSDTSQAALQAVTTNGRLGQIQQAVASYVQTHSPCTRADLADALSDGKEGRITAAVAELITLDQIRRGPKVVNPRTGQKVESLLYNPQPRPTKTEAEPTIKERTLEALQQLLSVMAMDLPMDVTITPDGLGVFVHLPRGPANAR